MREKKPYKILTFHNTTEAMACEKKCADNQIPGRLIPIPTEITAGCGLAWRMPVEEYPVYQEKMEKLELKFETVTELLL
jgi:hypothetical protein